MNGRPPTRMVRLLVCTGWLLGLFSQALLALDSLGPGVWADQNHQVVYASDSDGHPAAYSLRDARRVWRCIPRALLLYPIGAQWLALGQSDAAGIGKLLLMDGTSGAVVDELLFDLPPQVSARVLPTPLQQFDVLVRETEQGLQLHWQFFAYPLRGALMLSEGQSTASEGMHADGVFDVHLQDGGVRLIRRDDLTPDLSLPDPLVPASRHLPSLSAETRQFRSADGRQTMSPHPIENAASLRWRWEVASTGTSTAARSLELPFAYAPFLLLQSNLLYRAPPNGSYRANGDWQQQPASLVMQNLEDGSTLWSIEVLDRAFRGALPP